MKFRAELESTGKTSTGMRVPDELVAALGGGNRPKVSVTINGHTFRSSIARMGEGFWLGVSAERRAETGTKAGDLLDVDVELDTAPREVEVPADFAAALDAEPAARTFWATLSYSNQRWHVEQITGAKQEQTRANRIVRSIGLLREGRAR